MKSEIVKLTLTFLSSCFPTWPKKSGQKFKNVNNENSFSDEIKSIFHHFKRDLSQKSSQALKSTFKNNHKYNQEQGKLKKIIPLQVDFKDFVRRYRTAF